MRILLVILAIGAFVCAVCPCMLSSRDSQKEERVRIEQMIQNREVPNRQNQDIQV